MNGLLRYNEIQRALSSYRRDTGTKFLASFQKTASQIYHNTKTQPLKRVTENIDQVYHNILPEIPPEYLNPTPFFNYDIENRNNLGIVSPDLFPQNLCIKSPQLKGEKWVGTTADIDYQIMFKEFSDYINKNLGVIWTDSGDAPRFFFTPIEFDPIENCYFTTLTIDRDDAYGFIPGVEPEKRYGIIPSEKKEVPEEEIEIPEIEKPAKPTIKEKELEIKRIKAETDKLKASKEKLLELNRAVDRLESQLERGLITKEEYKQYLKKLYSF
jgi:hypothetical protein